MRHRALLAIVATAPALAQPSRSLEPRPDSPAVVREFSVQPTLIEAGATATLRWDVQYALAASIEPEIGPVATRGSRRVAPATTTTYTLEATGAGSIARRAVTVVVAERRPTR